MLPSVPLSGPERVVAAALHDPQVDAVDLDKIKGPESTTPSGSGSAATAPLLPSVPAEVKPSSAAVVPPALAPAPMTLEQSLSSLLAMASVARNTEGELKQLHAFCKSGFEKLEKQLKSGFRKIQSGGGSEGKQKRGGRKKKTAPR